MGSTTCFPVNNFFTEHLRWLFRTAYLGHCPKFVMEFSESYDAAFLQAKICNFIKKEALAQAFSCEFCEILRTPFL